MNERGTRSLNIAAKVLQFCIRTVFSAPKVCCEVSTHARCNLFQSLQTMINPNPCTKAKQFLSEQHVAPT